MRRLSAALIALIATAVLVCGASAATSSKTLTALPTSVFKVAGTSLYCTVISELGKPAVACFHYDQGAKLHRDGYAIVANDQLVGVEPGTANKVNWHRLTGSMAGVPVFSGGRVYGDSSIVTLHLHDVVAVGKTHMALVVTSADGGGLAIGVIYLDGNDKPLPHSYAIGISEHYVTVDRFDGKGANAHRLYRHAVNSAPSA